MKIIPCPLDGLFLYEAKKFGDHRGYFFESFRHDFFKQHVNNSAHFVQDNVSNSTKGTLRGLHFQAPPFAQAKLVHVVEGEVFDVAVDIRKDSPTYGQWHGVYLSGENARHFYIPHGFAHGFLVLSETAIFSYKCDNYYNKESEGGLLWNDPAIQITWPTIDVEVNLSEKDQELTSWENFESPF